MESVLVDIVPKEALDEGWEPESPIFVHRISNEVRVFNDPLNQDHDLVVSDPTRMRFRRAVVEESMLERFVVAIVDAFNPVQVALTKVLRIKTNFPSIPSLDEEKLKAAFNRFFSPFQAIVRLNRVEPHLKLRGNWPQKLTFSELTSCLAKLKEKFGNELRLQEDILAIEALYILVVCEGLEDMWKTFEDLGLDITQRETVLYSEIMADPVKFLPQWTRITDLIHPRHMESHPVTVGIKHDLVETRQKFITMQSAVEAPWAQSFKDVYELCLIHCKFLLKKAAVEIKKHGERFEDEFAKVAIP